MKRAQSYGTLERFGGCGVGFRFAVLSLVIFPVFLAGRTARSSEKAEYTSIGENVVLAYSLESWDRAWDACHAADLGNRLIEVLWEEVLPAVLKETNAPEPIPNLISLCNEVVDQVDWTPLRRSRLSLVLWYGDDSIPKLTLQIHPPDGTIEAVQDGLRRILSLPASHSPELWTWQTRDGIETLAPSSALVGPASEGLPWSATDAAVHLEALEDAIWVTFGHRAEQAASGPGLAGREGLVDTWKRIRNDETLSTFVLDFEALAGLLSRGVEAASGFSAPDEGEDPRVGSSLVLDETMEALFEDDPETLEKLKQVQVGMDELSSDLSGEDTRILALLNRLLGLLADQGFLVYSSEVHPQGIKTTGYWLPRAGSEGASLTESQPVSTRFLSLLRPDLAEVTLGGFPDFDLLYKTVVVLLQMLPKDWKVLESWEALQKTNEIDVQNDVLKAIGREGAWLERKAPKGAYQGFQVFSSEFYAFLSVADAPKVGALLGRLESLLEDFNQVVSATQVAGATFSVIDAGMMGKGMWGLIEDPPVLAFTNGSQDPDFFAGLVEALRKEEGGDLDKHPRWDAFEPLWQAQPTRVSLYNLGDTWRQTIDQIRQAQMMMTMMGASSPSLLSLMGLGLEFFKGFPEPDCLFLIGWNEDSTRVSQSLLLFPQKANDDTTERP